MFSYHVCLGLNHNLQIILYLILSMFVINIILQPNKWTVYRLEVRYLFILRLHIPLAFVILIFYTENLNVNKIDLGS